MPTSASDRPVRDGRDDRDPPVVDLNSDLGEGFGSWEAGDDEALLSVVTSANVACGFHAGDPLIMRRVCERAAALGVAVGAHVGYADLRGFGRRPVTCPPEELEADVVYQIGALQAVASAAGTAVTHVKPHGALYNVAVADPVVADAVVRACRSAAPDAVVVGLPGSHVESAAAGAGLAFAAEGFADRAYTPGGRLVDRRTPGAMVLDPDTVVERCLRMVLRREALTVDGEPIPLAVRTVCVHGDSPGAVTLARRVRAALEAAGVVVRPVAGPGVAR
ncbi:MAG: 5-oxoprolinase (ATP-hydrolyzing) subunit [Actinomycetota bacterium]|nr:5-oxoprolinase (ATP-hydrolyzing) subunit [Actinomycetota bacterium]